MCSVNIRQAKLYNIETWLSSISVKCTIEYTSGEKKFRLQVNARKKIKFKGQFLQLFMLNDSAKIGLQQQNSEYKLLT